MATESVNTGTGQPTDHTPAPEGHDQQMAEAFDQSQQTGDEGGEKILGKFNSQEELVEAYRQLEAKQSGGAEAEPQGGQTETERAAEEAVEQVDGLDMQTLSQEYAENGQLTDDSYEKLQKAGIPREMVDQYIEGQEAKAQAAQDEIVGEVGGDEQFQQMAQWASANMAPEEIDRYNEQINSNDPNAMRQAVQSLAFRYQQSTGSEPSLVGGGQASAGARYESVAQLTEAMSDPRYETDPAYRREVEQKLSRSNIL